MGLIKRAGGSPIPPGEKLRFRITKAVEDEGDHGPQVKFTLEVLDPQYAGNELFEWAKVAEDDEGDQYVADGGKLYNIAMACFGDLKTVDSFDSIAKLAKALEGKTFVSITKKRGEKYVGCTWDMIYPDPQAKKLATVPETEDEDDFNDIPF
jgi:hypothetical protein